MSANESMTNTILKKFPDADLEEFRDQLALKFDKERLLELMTFLKDDSELGFDYLTDITGVDYLKMEREPRFDVVYQLYSFDKNRRLRIKVGVDEDDLKVPSVASLWKAALWLEREAFEMFGFNFVDHPDLRRLLLPDIFDGHPLRKDYPLRGRGERDVILDLK
ncbi:NADH-quinone oxidoreductase subunit C [Candidatus Saccharibacteria bacterium]|nr:NADH-quinone oxidoreductase subunit C [Candidatus Saccharibacteria bacterium]NIV72430.1 NADH-quinone oxidoreductase subunit C [Calditrichia bacterium]NIW79812.1 NADH-quinone oxidoreductase subunit C [Calditrichia bacterium]